MALKLGNCGRLMKASVDALSDEQKKDRDAIYKALGDAIESYVQALLLQLQVGPTPGLGTTTTPGTPTGPGPLPIPGAALFK